MPESPFPDPNRTLDDYESDVAAYGVVKANWWRLRYVIDLELAIWRLWLISRLSSGLAKSATSPPILQIALTASLKNIAEHGKPHLMPGYLDEMRRRAGEPDQ